MVGTLCRAHHSDMFVREHGYGEYDEPPMDVWPQPLPKGMFFLLRCCGCDGLCYSAPEDPDRDGCPCGNRTGAILADRNFPPCPPAPPWLVAHMDQHDAKMREDSKWLR